MPRESTNLAGLFSSGQTFSVEHWAVVYAYLRFAMLRLIQQCMLSPTLRLNPCLLDSFDCLKSVRWPILLLTMSSILGTCRAASLSRCILAAIAVVTCQA